MDEPTNDLDMETLELLEELLLDYQGTLLLVSHDRDFLDHVVTSCLVFTGDCMVEEFVGGYSDWDAYQRQHQAESRRESAASQQQTRPQKETVKKSRSGKLSYKDQRELDALPARIESLEQQLETVQQQLSDPALYQSGGGRVGELQQQLHELEQALETAYDRWETLEEMLTGL
jgi:ATP-binding cassette subfamily F protein uup